MFQTDTGRTGTSPLDLTDTLQLFCAGSFPLALRSPTFMPNMPGGFFSACLMRLNIEPITCCLWGSLRTPPQHSHLRPRTLLLLVCVPPSSFSLGFACFLLIQMSAVIIQSVWCCPFGLCPLSTSSPFFRVRQAGI